MPISTKYCAHSGSKPKMPSQRGSPDSTRSSLLFPPPNTMPTKIAQPASLLFFPQCKPCISCRNPRQGPPSNQQINACLSFRPQILCRHMYVLPSPFPKKKKNVPGRPRPLPPWPPASPQSAPPPGPRSAAAARRPTRRPAPRGRTRARRTTPGRSTGADGIVRRHFRRRMLAEGRRRRS